MSIPLDVVWRLRTAIQKLADATEGPDGEPWAQDEIREAEEALGALLSAPAAELGRELGWTEARATIAGMLTQEALREDGLYEKSDSSADALPAFSRRALHSVRAEVLRDWSKIVRGPK